MHVAIPLGVFELSHPIGEGGMGEVWRGVHREQQVAVAVKVLRGQHLSSAAIQQAFLREVQSVARLLHPGIVRIFDYGVVSAEAAHASDGALVEQAPYIAMELATRGSLGALAGALSWRQLRWMLMEILNALAHAHARDLIHRDLKPDNILLTEGDKGQTCLKLTDFGIVHIADPDVSGSTHDMAGLFAGTPYYMSPEQLRGRWRDFGPWTDLYSLGCIAYEACCGRLPHEGNNVFDIAHRQMSEPVPPLTPRAPVPDGFEAWVYRLLEKSPARRFLRAADAAWALMQLPELPEDERTLSAFIPPTGPPPARAEGRLTLGDVTWSLEDEPHQTTQDSVHAELLRARDAGRAQEPPKRDGTIELKMARRYDAAPPLPASWARRQPPPPSLQLMGAGLGLYGLREIPLVARQSERDVIWGQLRAAVISRRPHAVVVRGQTGIGKSRLVNWSAERAHEVGGAIILRANHAPHAPPLSGLARLVARQLGCVGLDRAKTLARVQEQLQASELLAATADLDALALTELMHPGTGELTEQGPRVTLTTARERYIVIARLLEHLCRERAVMLVLDDAHWSQDTLEFARLLLSEPQSAKLPLLVVLILNDDAQLLIPRDHVHAIRDVVMHEHARELMLGALDQPAQRELIDALCLLATEQAAEVMNLSRGNPMFLVQLIGDWVQNDILQVGPRGYTLREGATLYLPRTLKQLWTTRLSQLIRTVQGLAPRFSPEDVRDVLELSAALGQEINFRAWGVACSHAQLAIPAPLISALIAQGFATSDATRWRFTHDVLRDQLVQSARESGRWARWHMACAAMIDALYDRHDPEAPERLVYHLQEAQAHQLAIAPLCYLCDRALLRAELGDAERALEQLAQTLTAINAAPTDPGAGALLWRRASLTRHLHGPKSAAAQLAAAPAQTDPEARAAIALLLARIALDGGDHSSAREHASRASELYASRGDARGVGACLLLLGLLHSARQDHREAVRCVRDGIDLLRAERIDSAHSEEDWSFFGEAYRVLGVIYRAHERPDKATLALQRARRYFNEVGDALGQALVRLELGHLARDRDDLDVAARFYLDAREALESLHHALAPLARFYEAIILLPHARFDEAAQIAERAASELLLRGMFSAAPLGLLTLAVAHAGRGERALWEGLSSRLEELLPAAPRAERDLARYMELAADLWRARREPEQALALYDAALVQLDRLGDEERARNVRHRKNLVQDSLAASRRRRPTE